MRVYEYYTSLTERWKNEENLVLNPYTLESEVKGNFLVSDDNQKLNYIKLLNYKLSSLKVESARIEDLLVILKIDIGNGLISSREVIDFSNNEVSTFVYGIEDVLFMARGVENVINENIEIFHPTSNNSDFIEPNANLQWKGDKTDLAELVWALAKSNRITDTTTGQPVTQVELTRQFETLFGLTLDVTGLMKGRMKTYKATSDGNTFVKTLLDLINSRAANS